MPKQHKIYKYAPIAKDVSFLYKGLHVTILAPRLGENFECRYYNIGYCTEQARCGIFYGDIVDMRKIRSTYALYRTVKEHYTTAITAIQKYYDNHPEEAHKWDKDLKKPRFTEQT